MIQGVLFDLDGVIVDTLHDHFLAWNHMFEKYGGSVREETVLLHEGRKSHEILPILMQESGIQIPPDRQEEFLEDKRTYYRQIARVSQFPDAFDIVDTVKRRGFKTALVTSCTSLNMQHALNPRQRSRFDLILTGDDVHRAKPSPEAYATAARRLGLQPEECVVVENAPLGIEAAKAAGMVCIAVESTLNREFLSDADCILKNLGELTGNPLLAR